MAIEKCINEFDVDDVIFEEGSTGRELFVVLDGQVEIAKVNATVVEGPPTRLGTLNVRWRHALHQTSTRT